MKKNTRLFTSSAGFTLVEMLVATVVLVLLVVLVSQLTNSAVLTTTNSRKHMDTDSQARTVFDRMASDFDKMVKRSDVDYIFYKNSPGPAGSPGVNDSFFFYSEAPGYFDNPPPLTAQGTASLVGYRVNNDNPYYPGFPVLERLGKGLTWDGVTSGTTPGGPVFLTTLSGSAIPASTGYLDGNWTTLGTAAQNYSDGTDPDYHVLSDQVYRLEIAFLLTDGSTSSIPVTNPGSFTNNLSASAPPTSSSDNTQHFAPGSRWFDTTGGRGYICTNSSTGAAVWNPIGIKDISAVIVTIAILDANSRKIINNATNMVGALRDPVPADFTTFPANVMAQSWLSAVNSGSFATNSGIPRTAASQVRIYQRYFYINGITK
ncbi:MAG: prepilin-type N-terminal cleavage/methylation domain-containing protein [Chthoniobacteraceae bacterium]